MESIGFTFIQGSKDLAAHSSTLPGESPWTEEPGGPQPMGAKSQTRLSEHK